MKKTLLVLVMLLLCVVGYAQRSSVETIYGYLRVFPEEIGSFDAEPRTIIKQLNHQTIYGYNTWRIPTNEELALLRSKGYASNVKYMTKESTSGLVLLVTDKAAVVKEVLGHAFVDLGLPSGLKWATCNVGANSPSEYGNYYAWIEINTKESYAEDNCVTYSEQVGELSGNPKYDVARAKWGGNWRMPTKTEMHELLNSCTWIWVSQGGKNGYKVVGPNGNSIFLPATGYRIGTSLLDAEKSGYLWTSTPDKSEVKFASSLYINNATHSLGLSDRSVGFAVRPVIE